MKANYLISQWSENFMAFWTGLATSICPASIVSFMSRISSSYLSSSWILFPVVEAQWFLQPCSQLFRVEIVRRLTLKRGTMYVLFCKQHVFPSHSRQPCCNFGQLFLTYKCHTPGFTTSNSKWCTICFNCNILVWSVMCPLF